MMITILTKPVPVNQRYGMMNGRMLLTKQYRKAKKYIAHEIRAQHVGHPVKHEVAINIIQYFGDKRKRDCDAYIKIILDAAEGILYEDDCQVTEIHVYKHYDKKNPRIELSMV